MKKIFLFSTCLFFLFQCQENPNMSSDIQQSCNLETTFINVVDSLKWPKGNDMVLSNNCGYVGVGRLSSRPWIIKFDQEGREVWSKIFEEIPIPQGNYSDGYQFASAIDNTNDGGYILCTAVSVNHPSYNSTGYIIKVDSLGQTEWFNELPSNRAYHGRDVIQTNEGDYIVVGNWYTSSAVTNEKSAFIARYSESGSLIWIERYGGECDEDVFYSVIQKQDGGFILVGKFEHESSDYNCDFYGYTDLWFVNLDSDGRMLAETKIGGSYWESAVDVIDLENGFYGVAGRKRHTRNKPVNAWFLKMDSNGNIQSEWDEPDYINNSGRGDQLNNLVLSKDRSTVIALGARFDMPTDYMLLNLWGFDVMTGQELWNVTHGQETAGENFATGIVNGYDGGFTFFGFTDNHRLKIIKTDDIGMIPLEE